MQETKKEEQTYFPKFLSVPICAKTVVVLQTL
jgi:hypothetical protein